MKLTARVPKYVSTRSLTGALGGQKGMRTDTKILIGCGVLCFAFALIVAVMRHGASHLIVLLPSGLVLVVFCIALVGSTLIHRYFPYVAVQKGLQIGSLFTWLPGVVYYLWSMLAGEPNPEGAAHMGIFIFPLFLFALLVLILFITTVLGLAIRLKHKTG